LLEGNKSSAASRSRARSVCTVDGGKTDGVVFDAAAPLLFPLDAAAAAAALDDVEYRGGGILGSNGSMLRKQSRNTRRFTRTSSGLSQKREGE
jgi:hypothetical protein